MPKPIIKKPLLQRAAGAVVAAALDVTKLLGAPVPRSKPIIKRRPTMQRICGRCGGEEYLTGAKCSFCNSKQHLREPKPGEVMPPPRMLMAVGGNAWGLGMLAEDAVAGMQKNLPVSVRKAGGIKYQLWDVPRSAYVTIGGQIAYKVSDKAPKLIKEGTL